jgi:hypothetical protein
LQLVFGSLVAGYGYARMTVGIAPPVISAITVSRIERILPMLLLEFGVRDPSPLPQTS